MKEKQEVVVEQFKKALEAGREAKTTGEVQISVKLHEGGIRHAQVTIQRQIV